jgi:hypothetical protein
MPHRCAAALLAIAGLLALASTASATLVNTPDHIWVPNGTVFATARTADRIYVGGVFTRVAPLVGGFARFAGGSDQLLGEPPEPTLASGRPGSVFCIVDDGAGGFYLGGRFDAVGGVARHDLAHILADGSLDPAFAPDPDGDVTVLARGGTTVYAAGSFTTIGGAARTHVAAVDGAGHATAWAPALDATPYAIAVAGSTVYLGGAFTTINGTARPNAGAVDAASGATTGWDPQPNDYVYRIAPAGSSVFIGGAFGAVHGTMPLYGLAKVDATTGLPALWVPVIHHTTGSMVPAVTALAVSGSTVYVGGAFDMVGGVARHNAAAVDGTTAALAAWDPNVGPSTGISVPSVSAIGVSGSTVYVTGSFQTINGTVARTSAATVDATTGTAGPWAPWLGGDADGIALSGGTIAIAGGFAIAGGVARTNAAALDAADGTATSWDPEATGGSVLAFAPDGGDIFLGGEFTKIGNATRRGLAKVDDTTGLAVSTWDADLNNSDLTLALSGRTLYVGGRFNGAGSIGGFGRHYVAAVDADTAAVAPWAPDPDAEVSSIAVVGDVVYLGGPFTQLLSFTTPIPRSRVGAVTTAGTVTAWNPAGADGLLASFGSSVFLTGTFAGPTGGQAVDGSTAVPGLPLVSVAAATVESLAADSATLFLGGAFTTADGQPRTGLAAIDLATGTLSPWHPDLGASPLLQNLAVDGRGGVVSSPDFLSFSALPQATASPSVAAGTAAAGQAATCANGAWGGSIPQRYAFAWLRDGALIGDAGGASYTPVASDVGHLLSCRVTATNLGGTATADSATVSVAVATAPQAPGGSPKGTPPDRTRPTISSLKLAPSTFVALERGGSTTAARKLGTAVGYRVSEPATVVFTVQRRTVGRRSGRSCVKATKRLRSHKSCTRYVAVKGSFTRKRTANGTDKLRFSGRLAGHTLGAGRYRLRLVATDAAKNHSVAATAAFTIKRG